MFKWFNRFWFNRFALLDNFETRTKHMDEQEEFEQYEEHIKWLELAKEDIATWISCVQTEAQTDQQRKVEKYKINKYNHTT